MSIRLFKPCMPNTPHVMLRLLRFSGNSSKHLLDRGPDDGAVRKIINKE